ncbi:D-aspartate oxidase [Aplysia californica]|uniref:D-aspartate oxidase n=1 Tax=Aplysia californica TaxID=6500 RepID=A0ABM1A947_APLCA|nr:D-aspartate oxidase [Aplysia californica]
MEESSRPRTVVVLGAGVSGLSCAVSIKEACPEVEVELVSETFSPHTTGDGSAGFWIPYILGDTSISLIRETCKATYDYLIDLAFDAQGPAVGVQQISGYTLFTYEEEKYELFHDLVDGYRILQPSELKKFPAAKSGYFYTSVQVNTVVFLPWLMQKFKSMGGKVRCAKVDSLKEFSGQCDVIVNCCGLGSKQLLNDQQMVPVRGQVLRVSAPWVKHFYLLKNADGNLLSYILPSTNEVVVGGTAEKGVWDTTCTEEDSQKIWTAATDFLPMLKEAKILRPWAGLRPGRSSLRLEKEELEFDGQPMKVVHNYGHGGAGVTLFHGCAQRVKDMVKECLRPEASSSSTHKAAAKSKL